MEYPQVKLSSHLKMNPQIMNPQVKILAEYLIPVHDLYIFQGFTLDCDDI